VSGGDSRITIFSAKLLEKTVTLYPRSLLDRFFTCGGNLPGIEPPYMAFDPRDPAGLPHKVFISIALPSPEAEVDMGDGDGASEYGSGPEKQMKQRHGVGTSRNRKEHGIALADKVLTAYVFDEFAFGRIHTGASGSWKRPTAEVKIAMKRFFATPRLYYDS
jgi:hypothetical protein